MSIVRYIGVVQAGLLLAETEYVKQVESDIASYKGLLMGLFFMTVRTQPLRGAICSCCAVAVACCVLRPTL